MGHRRPIHPVNRAAHTEIPQVLHRVGRHVIVIVAAPFCRREAVEVLQPQVQSKVLGHQCAHGHQGCGHLVELQPGVQLGLISDRRFAEILHDVLTGGAFFQQKRTAQADGHVLEVLGQRLPYRGDEVQIAGPFFAVYSQDLSGK
jgi:hypothetical protein